MGWSAQYQCGEGLYQVTLRRSTADQLIYSADGLTLSSDITYDDIDPNLNQPLLVQDPVEGLRYSFSQTQGDDFYEYAIADYSGDIGLYIYQTGQQIVATPCTVISSGVSSRS
ncbi:MAG: hypothetical protein HC800_18455 [Phormidesmis sp. RL_2_1]|nr:hypothetical protein [Phormidesmis sp. RL_2_1]